MIFMETLSPATLKAPPGGSHLVPGGSHLGVTVISAPRSEVVIRISPADPGLRLVDGGFAVFDFDGVELWRSRTGKGSSGGRKKGVV